MPEENAAPPAPKLYDDVVPELIVPRATLELERLFTPPAACVTAPLVDSTSGAPSRLTTTVAAFHDATHLYVIFSGSDDDPFVATHLDRDANLFDEDVVEVFLAPEKLERYFEFEVNPRGTLFDAAVDSPDRDRRTMHVDRGWDSPGLWGAVRRDGDGERATFSTVVAIPFGPLGRMPAPGEAWRANFYRIDRHASGDLFAAWSPSLRQPADFHVPDSFGTIRFE